MVEGGGTVEIGRCVPCFLGESLINTRVVWFVTGCRGVGKKKEKEERERKKGKGKRRKKSSDKRDREYLEKNELV